MIKKTLYFGNPVYLSLKNAQLVIKLPEFIITHLGLQRARYFTSLWTYRLSDEWRSRYGDL